MKLKYFLPLILLSSLLYAQNLTRHTVNLQRGLNTKIDKSVSNAPYVLENLHTDESIGFTTRTGITEISSAPIAGINNTKIWSVKFSNGEEFILAQYEKYLYFTSDKASWTLIRNDLKWQLNPLQMAVINDEIYFTNGIDHVFYVTGDLISGKYYADLPFIKKGKYILADKNKLFIANTYTYPSRVYYTLSGADPKNSDSWSEIQYVVAGFKDGDYITGLASYGRNQTLILNRSSIWGLFGYGPLTWGKPMKITSNYGCISQESVQMVRGKLYFLDRGGIVSYNGSFFDGAVDFVIEDDIKGSNNVKGEYRFWRQALNSDFGAGTYNLRISTNENELKLDKYSYEWVADTFTYGTTSNIAIKDTRIQLSTTTQSGVSRYQTGNPANIVKTVVSNGARVWNHTNGKWYDDYSGDNTSSELTWTIYDNLFNIVDIVADVSDFINTYAENMAGSLHGTTMDRQIDNVHYTATPHYIFELNTPGTDPVGGGILLDRIELKFDASLSSYYLYTWYAKLSHASDTTHTLLYLLTTLEYKGGGKRTIKTPLKKISDWDVSVISGKNKEIDTLFWDYMTGNTITIDINEIKKVDRIIFDFYTETFKNFSAKGVWPTSMGLYDFSVNVSRLYDVSIYEKTSEPVHKTTGTYTSTASDKISSYDVKWGTITFDAYTNYSAEGTTMAFRTRTSTQTSTPIDTWSSWSTWSSTPTFKITSPDGKYIQFRSSFTTTISSHTPVLYSVDITAIASTGTWKSKKFNKGKQKVSKYFITDVSLNGQTANFWVKVATGSTALDSASWTSITSGSTITATTSETWIQLEVGLETTIGTQNPTVRSMTVLWSPEIEPTVSASLSKDDRYMLALSTISAGTTNTLVYVLQKNDEWTMYTGWTPSAFTSFGADFYMGDGSSNKIFKLSTSTTDNGTAITCKRKQSFYFGDYSRDKKLSYIFTSGLQKTGNLSIIYQVENSTVSQETIFDMSKVNRWRHKQPVRSSAVSSFEVIYQSTSPVSIFSTELIYKVLPEFRR